MKRPNAYLLVALLVLMAAFLVALLATAQPARAETFPPAPLALSSDPSQAGIRPSTYTGDFFDAVDEPYRMCVVYRESRGNYDSVNSANHRGAYQLSKALGVGAAWMMTAELKRMFPERWELIRDTLRDNVVSRWSRFYQDMAFWTVWNWEGPRSGRHHWAHRGTRCIPGMSA